MEGGEQLAPANVIVQSVSWGISPGDSDTLGSPVPLAQLVGSGNALILSDGKAVRATWTKAGDDAVTDLHGVGRHAGEAEAGPHVGGAGRKGKVAERQVGRGGGIPEPTPNW